MPADRPQRSTPVATRLFVWQLAGVTLVILFASVLTYIGSVSDAEKAAAGRSMAAAQAIAHNPFVQDALSGANPGAVLQPYARALVADSDISFLSVFSAGGVRYAASSPDGIGPSFSPYGAALRGRSYSQDYVGPLGPAVRSVVPISGQGGTRVAGVVVAAVDLDDVQSSLGSRIVTLTLSGLAFLLIAGLGAWGLSRYLRRVTQGRGAAELGNLFRFYESVLHSLDEGLLLMDERARVVLANSRAARMLDLPHAPTTDRPATFDELGLDPELRAVLEDNERLVDEVVVTDELFLVINKEPVAAANDARRRSVGSVVTIRDRTRIQELSGELAGNAVLTDALRAQTHEFGNRLHTIIALIELGRTNEAIELAGSEVGIAQQLADSMVEVGDEPVLTALLLGKSAQARERGVRFDVQVTGAVGQHSVPTRELITIVGNLVDNALDAVALTDDPSVTVRIEGRATELLITVEDSGRGPDPAVVEGLFELGATTKSGQGRARGVGLALVRQCVRRLGGSIAVSGSAFAVRLPLAEEVTTPA